MSKWEYKIINIRSENYRLDPNAATQLNQLGEEGWELVSITSVNFKTGATDNIAMVFKRPVAAGGLRGADGGEAASRRGRPGPPQAFSFFCLRRFFLRPATANPAAPAARVIRTHFFFGSTPTSVLTAVRTSDKRSSASRRLSSRRRSASRRASSRRSLMAAPSPAARRRQG